MTEYISRADALKAMDCKCLHKGIVDALQSLILDVPASDVRPVVRGKWEKAIEQPYIRKHYHRVACSVCHHEGMERWSFCPNCGANMREEDA